ncbi:MAG TPA: toxin-antitoxin system HicB family antitoxin [Candidatus Eisenbacteria bacterium]
MSIKSFTLRIDPLLRRQLDELAEASDTPLNRLINEALRDFVGKRSLALEGELQSRIERLRAYRRHDPNHERAIEAFAKAEGTVPDPVEGRATAKSGPIRKKIVRLLNG